MRDLTTEDPAEVVLAWEAVEELLAAIPESPAKVVLRMVAAGLPADEIAERLGLAVADVEVLAARRLSQNASAGSSVAQEPCEDLI